MGHSTISPTSKLDGLNKMTFGNVAANKQNRHIGHFAVAIVLISYTLYLLWREYNHYVEIRQTWMQSSAHLALARTRTIAISNVPTDVNSGAGLKELATTVGRLTGTSGPRPSNVEDGSTYETETGGVRKVWLTRKVKDLEKVWDERNKECARLEGGVGKLVKLANKNERSGKTPEKQGMCERKRFDFEQW